MRQADLEREMVELGRDRYWSKVKRSRDAETETFAPVAKRLLGESIEKLDVEIQNWIHNSRTGPGRRHRVLPYFELLPTELMAALTARTVLDGISQQRTLTSISIRLGQYLEDEYRARKIQEDEPGLWRDIFSRVKSNSSYVSKRRHMFKVAKGSGIFLPLWGGKDRCAIGLVLVELMRVATGLIEIETTTNIFSRSVTLVRATPSLLEWVKKAHAYHEILTPVFMPMVVPPLEWRDVWVGGYLGDEVRRRPLIKTYDKSYLEELDQTEMPEVYKAINSLQHTGFQVNEDVLNCMLYCYENNSQMGGIPANKDHDIPDRPSDKDWEDEVIQRSWRRQAREVHALNSQDRSKRLQLSKVLYLAQKFVDRPIYYPMQMDFRSRVYPVPNYLHPQGPDWGRSLLRFSKGDVIEDQNQANWLGLHTANCWGLDKKTVESRLGWVWSNEDLFKAIYRDPLENTQWSEAEEPWQFLAAAMDFGEFLETGFGHVSRTPVAQDATNQGLQIYAMLLRDPVAALSTNVSPSDKPNDLYQVVADGVVKRLEESDNEWAALWLKFGIGRKTVKRQTMVLPYGGTQQSCKEYTIEWYQELTNRKVREKLKTAHPFKACIWLSGLIWDSISAEVLSARMGMDWLRQVAGICLDNGVLPRWHTPVGYPVRQLYERQASYEVKTSIGSKIRRHRLQFGKGEPAAGKHKNAICPNFVHSLDAALMMKTVNLCSLNGIDQFSMIHDSYATTAAHSGMMSTCLRQATVDMFSEDLLQDFSDQITRLLPSEVELPPVPFVGGLEIESVFDSQYYFA